MKRSTKRSSVGSAGVLWSAALAGALALSAPALAQLGGGNKKPETPPAQPQPVSQNGVTVAPGAGNPNAEPVRRATPPLEASPGRIDMGVMKPSSKISGSVTLTNTGDETLKIARVNSSCSCTVADLPKRELAPGESVELSATLESGNYIGAMQRQVRVFVEGYAAPYEVWVVADVTYDVKADPVYIGAFQGDSGEVKVTEVSGKPFRILSVNNNAPTFKNFDSSDAAAAEYTLTWTTKGVDPKDLPYWWVIETDHPDAPVVDLRVLHPSVMPRIDPRRAWQLSEDRALIGYLEPGETKNVTIELKERRRAQEELPLPVVTPQHENIKVEVVKLEKHADGYTLELSISGSAAADGKTLIVEPLTITWRDTEETFWVFGRLTKRPEGGHALAN